MMKPPTEAMVDADEVSAIFANFDRDHSGDIDAAELRAALFALGLPTDDRQAKAILGRFDFNADGSIDRAEFRRLVDELRGVMGHRSSGEVLEEDRVFRVFHRFDRDEAGAMEAAELRHALELLGLPTDVDEAVLRRYERDRAGTLSLQEFREACFMVRRAATRRTEGIDADADGAADGAVGAAGGGAAPSPRRRGAAKDVRPV